MSLADESELSTRNSMSEVTITAEEESVEVILSNDIQNPFPHRTLSNRKRSRNQSRRFDSLDHESRHYDTNNASSHEVRIHLSPSSSNHDPLTHGGRWPLGIFDSALLSIGMVYGDFGTSPLYVYSITFVDGINHNDDILGVLSLIIYTITLIPLLKYVFIAIQADDNGDGGPFAMYSLICRYAKVGLMPSEEASDQDVSTFRLELPSNTRMRLATKLKSKLENSKIAKFFLLFATMFLTSMAIADGVLTPCISVLSAVEGIKVQYTITQGQIVWISVAILICLFASQRLGTDKLEYASGPIILVWFILIAGIGVFNFFKYDPAVAKAINPAYILDYFKRNKKNAWISLGGVVLAITGTDALFTDLGQFSVRSIQISMCTVTYPALILAYTGQAAFLRKHGEDVSDTFYSSLPRGMFWTMFVVSVLAAIVASQAAISWTFTIIQQSLSFGCFPRVKIVQTSTDSGQVYIPEINFLLMLACIGVTVGFKTTEKLGNAYGISVIFVTTLTSGFLVLIMIMIWKINIFLVITYILTIGFVELIYLSSGLYNFNFDQGGYLPFAFAMASIFIMLVWNNVRRKKYFFELDNEVSSEKLQEIVADTNSSRMPGLAVFYSELVHGIPPIFKHYVESVPSLHSVLVFVSIKSLPISKVPIEERFLFRRVQPNDLNVFRCVVRYGYTDAHNEQESFERTFVERLKNFIALEKDRSQSTNENVESDQGVKRVEFEKQKEDAMGREMEVLDRAWRAGVVHLVGEHKVIAGNGANIGKRILIDYAYNYLKRNVRQINEIFDIPQKRMLKVGMTYEL